jgi:hypothetical protein
VERTFAAESSVLDLAGYCCTAAAVPPVVVVALPGTEPADQFDVATDAAVEGKTLVPDCLPQLLSVAEFSECVSAQIEQQLGTFGPVCAPGDFGLAYSTLQFGSSAGGLVLVPVVVE